jgi:hypothetical protein
MHGKTTIKIQDQTFQATNRIACLSFSFRIKTDFEKAPAALVLLLINMAIGV